jgi:low density lipoprotein-related protein 2
VAVTDVEHPKALTIWDTTDPNYQEPISILYYSEYAYEQLIAFNLRTQEKRILRNNVNDIVALRVYKQPQTTYSNSPCGVNNGGCHHMCIPSRQSPTGRQCRCANGLRVRADGSCVLFDRILLYSSANIVSGIPFGDSIADNGPSPSDSYSMPDFSSQRTGKLDFDYESGSIVWIENSRLVRILQFNRNWASSNRPDASPSSPFYTVRTLFELDSPNGALRGLTVDWINKMLYYTYTQAPITYIKACRFPQADYHYTLIASKNDSPAMIAVNPRLRYLYWIDDGQTPKIEMAQLTGADRTVIVQTDIVSPTDIFVDVNTGDVYWTDDVKDRIERVGWNGTSRVIVKSTNTPSPKAVVVATNGLLYYADARLRGIYSINLTVVANMSANTRGAQLVRRFGIAEELVDLSLYDVQSQPTIIDSPCGLLSSPCEQLCFALPKQATPQCACAIGQLDPNGRTCKKPLEYLIYTMENEIRSLAMDTSIGTMVPWRPLGGLSMAVGIDFDYQDGKIFFTDIVDRKLSWFSVSTDSMPTIISTVYDLITNNQSRAGSGGASGLMTRNISQPDGVAYDWVADTIYWADKQLKSVISLNIKSGMRYVVAYSDAPRAIVVHPCKGYVFWTV